MSIRLDERRYVEELKRLVADFRMWKNPLVPLPDGFEDDLAWSNVAFLILFKTKIGFLGRSKIRVKGQNVCLARRVAGVRFGLFECRLSGCSRCR